MKQTLANSRQETEDGFDRVFLENYDRILGLTSRLTGNIAEAEDITIDCFVRLWLQGPGLTGNWKGWLYRVATRLAYNAMRSSSRRRRNEQMAAADWKNGNELHDPLLQAERAQRSARARRALESMRKRSAQLVVLHYSGFSYSEIADALRVSPGSVGTLLARAEREFEKKISNGG